MCITLESHLKSFSILSFFFFSLVFSILCRQDILKTVTKTFLCEQYSEQIALFLLPAMAYGKYPFPFVELIHTLIEGASNSSDSSMSVTDAISSTSTSLQTPSANNWRSGEEEDTPWLLASVLMLANKEIGKMVAVYSPLPKDASFLTQQEFQSSFKMAMGAVHRASHVVTFKPKLALSINLLSLLCLMLKGMLASTLVSLCLFGFLTSSSTKRLYRRRAPRQSVLTILGAATHETELGDHDFCLSRSGYTDTDPTSRERAATAGIEPGTSSPEQKLHALPTELPPPPPLFQYPLSHTLA